MSFWFRTEVREKQSRRKQQEKGSTGQCTDRDTKDLALHGSGARTVQRGVFVLLRARVSHTGRAGEACGLIFRVARGVSSLARAVFIVCMGLGTGRVRSFFSGSARGVLIFCMGHAISPF